MNIFSEQKTNALVATNGWSPDFAAGFLKGEYSRKSSARLSPYAMVGLDEYCLGFRAGYFERQNPAATRVETPAAPEPAAQSVRGTPVAGSTTPTTFKQEFAY